MGIKTKVKTKSKGKEEVLKKKKKKSKEGGSKGVERTKKGAKKRKTKEVVVLKPIREKLSRSGLVAHLVDETAVDAKDVKKIILALGNAMKASIMRKGVGEFAFDGLFKIKTKLKPKQKGGEKVKNPFKPGTFMITKAKPAMMKVKVLAMKRLKDAAAVPSKDD